MKLAVRFHDAIAVVDLVGRLVYGDGEVELKETIQKLLDEGTTSIILNMENLVFMDSAGMVSLITCLKRVIERGGALRILKPSRRAAELLTVSRLTEIFEMYQDEQEAVRSF